MHDVPLLISITIALVVAFIGGIIARRIGLPTIVGYLLAGIVIGPFTPGFKGDVETIQQLAELGVIFLMFGVGLHFSFKDLWNVRDIAIPGAMLQTLLATLLGVGLSLLWGWNLTAGIVLGLSVSVASTVVLLRGLMDHTLLNTSHGQAAVGWLVMEDILSVLILVLLPSMAVSTGGFDWMNLVVTLFKALAFVVVMFFFGTKMLPWALERIAHTRSRELFILAILAITLGTAMGAAELFGVSLALGAFVAGAIISQSPLSYQVGADVFSFREAFSVLFFVSVGMLVNPTFLWQNVSQVIALSLLVLIGKPLIVLILGLLFPRPARTFLVIAVGLAQVGEFSFIIGQAGVSLNLLNADQYSLILAASLISITINPFLFKLLPRMEKLLKRMPEFWRKLESAKPLPEIDESKLMNHAVIIGYGRVGKQMVDVLESLEVPMLVIESDAEQIDTLNKRKIPTLFGDAANSEVLMHASLEKARILVITVQTESASSLVITTAKNLNPRLPIVARASSQEGVRVLAKLGAQHTVQAELEEGLELISHALISLGFPLKEVYDYAESVRHDNYELNIAINAEHQSLYQLLHALKGVELTWLSLPEDSPIIGKSLAESNIRAHTGASIVALIRNNELTANPKSMTIFEAGDQIGIIGESDQISKARCLIGIEGEES